MVADIGAALAKVFGGLRERDRAELLDALSLQRGVLDRYPGTFTRVLLTDIRKRSWSASALSIAGTAAARRYSDPTGMRFAVLAHLCGAAHFTDIACNLGA
jgi:hypothetical protein